MINYREELKHVNKNVKKFIKLSIESIYHEATLQLIMCPNQCIQCEETFANKSKALEILMKFHSNNESYETAAQLKNLQNKMRSQIIDSNFDSYTSDYINKIWKIIIKENIEYKKLTRINTND